MGCIEYYFMYYASRGTSHPPVDNKQGYHVNVNLYSLTKFNMAFDAMLNIIVVVDVV